MTRLAPPGAGQVLDIRSCHQQLDLVVVDLEPEAKGELGVHPAGAVGAA
ncbi:hypothetical protein MCEMAEM6B_00290 [Mycobacteriaceae bacterium]